MGLFLPSDPPDPLGEFKPLGPAKRPKTPQNPGTLQPTGTPGVFKNTKTGKLETDIPIKK